jgi:N6-adenosine-specific RNA methylase IME4
VVWLVLRIPGGPWELLYTDPPWNYDFGTDTPDSIETHYDVLELDDIKNIEIDTADDAALYLWTTGPMLKKAFEVIEAWGFEYRTGAVWDKISLGMGHWFRINHEHLLVARKGTFPPPREDLRVSSVIREKKRGHSQKPDIVRTWLTEWYPDAKKIELFAREHFEGWSAWGNEVPDSMQTTLIQTHP